MVLTSSPRDAQRRWWVPGLGAATLLGLVVRLWYIGWHDVPSEPGFLVNFDPIFYHRQATAVADGLGFIAPHLPGHQASAGHPPLLVVVLAAASRLGLDSFEAHRVVTGVIGAAVVPVVGLLAGRLFGLKAGLVAAVVAAVHPQLWINDGLVMPEGLYALLVAAALWAGVVAWDRPQRRLAVALGVLVGLASLTRGEGVLLVLFLVVPLALVSPGFSGRRERVWFGGLAVVAVVVTIAPWTLYNLTRFDAPVLVSTAGETTLAGANCDLTYSGDDLGSWTTACFRPQAPGEDESRYAEDIRRQALAEVRESWDRQPLVVAARVGRLWDLYRPQANLDLNELQNRPRGPGVAAVAASALLAVAALTGLRRRHALRRALGGPVLLLLATFAMASVTAALTYGNSRFRLPADLALVVLAAGATVNPAWRWWTSSTHRAGRSGRAAPRPAPGPPPGPAGR